jgi:hypothetical protein
VFYFAFRMNVLSWDELGLRRLLGLISISNDQHVFADVA